MLKKIFFNLNLGLLVLILLACVFPGLFTSYGPNEISFKEKFEGPSARHWMGTDDMGRDLLARVLYGGRVTIFSALLIALGSLFIALIWAGISSFSGGLLDEWMTRIADMLMNIPGMLFAMIFVSLTGPGMFGLVFSLILIKWAGDARILRSHMLSLVYAEYIQAARCTGCNFFWIFRRHVLPNTTFLIFTLFGLGFASSILSIASLNFLGFGVKLPNPEWGAMINSARAFLQTYPHLMLFPGAAIALTILSTHFFVRSLDRNSQEGNLNYL